VYFFTSQTAFDSLEELEIFVEFVGQGLEYFQNDSAMMLTSNMPAANYQSMQRIYDIVLDLWQPYSAEGKEQKEQYQQQRQEEKRSRNAQHQQLPPIEQEDLSPED
jgi:hypothetical protein